MELGSYSDQGWIGFAPQQQVLDWVKSVQPIASALAQDTQFHADWLRHGKTWFAGVNVLPNDGKGAVNGGPDLQGVAMDWIKQTHGDLSLDAAQISVIYPGYPKQDPSESLANHRFRLNRDAAHVDGLTAEGPHKRRFLTEPHAYVLGIPLTQATDDASPMVIWEGSHHIMRAAFKNALKDVSPSQWSSVDLTDVYKETRRHCFDVCVRKVIYVPLGGAYVVHRLALHGVAPWGAKAYADAAGRMIAYFRPELTNGAKDWLQDGV